MRPFYKSQDRIAALEEVARSWIGTPFAAHSMVKGAGVDCVHLCAAIYIATGAIREFKPPQYALDAGHYNERSQLLEWLNNSTDFQIVWFRARDGHPMARLQAGDVLCLNFNRSEHHAGLLLDGRKLVHAPFNRPVCETSLDDPLIKRTLAFAYRPIETIEEIPRGSAENV